MPDIWASKSLVRSVEQRPLEMAVKNIACFKSPIFQYVDCHVKLRFCSTEGHLHYAQKPKFGSYKKEVAMAFEVSVKKMHNNYQQR
jgi:hypothetical protein